MDTRNLDEFLDNFPDLKYSQIEDRCENSKKAKPINISDPDRTFCAFVLSLGMALLSFYVLQSQRDYTTEYFSRQVIVKHLDDNPYGFLNYD